QAHEGDKTSTPTTGVPLWEAQRLRAWCPVPRRLQPWHGRHAVVPLAVLRAIAAIGHLTIASLTSPLASSAACDTTVGSARQVRLCLAPPVNRVHIRRVAKLLCSASLLWSLARNAIAGHWELRACGNERG